MALGLSENWATEILRARIAAAVGIERAGALEPGYPDDHPLAIPAGVRYGLAIGAEALKGAAAAAAFTGGGNTAQGSNAWVVGGSRTVTGKPLLANDPHLAIQMPSLWYENHLVGGDYNVAGASVPGAPGVVIGHNERIAWGVTNGMTDVQDLHVESFDPTDPTRYLFRGEWPRAEVIREEIVVRGRRDPVVEEVRVTRHGPVISPLLTDIPGGTHPEHAENEQPLALRWTALEPGRIARSTLALNRAVDWDSFRAALADWTVPAQNFVYADVDGHVGYALGGDIPIRARGDGRLPVPGDSGEYEWMGQIPHDALPHVLDPAEDLVVTANNRIAAGAYPYPLPSEWLPGYRAARIRALLEETSAHDTASFARIHADQLSLPGLRVAALAGVLPAETEIKGRARQALATWDGQLTADSIGGAIYTRLCNALVIAATADISGPLGSVARLGALASPPAEMYLARALPHVLRAAADRDDSLLPAGTTWDQALRAAWTLTIRGLRQELGDDVDTWTYGRSHTLTLRHPLSAVPLLGRLLNRGPFAMGGDINTVCMGDLIYPVTGPPAYTAPSYRQICDTSDWNRCVSVLPTGQSGHPGSRHYADMTASWLRGEYHQMPWTRDRVDELASDRLILMP